VTTDPAKLAHVTYPTADVALAARQIAASFELNSVESTAVRAPELGATVELAAHEGPHESRAVLCDPDGNNLRTRTGSAIHPA
jgi:hypothetical protein